MAFLYINTMSPVRRKPSHIASTPLNAPGYCRTMRRTLIKCFKVFLCTFIADCSAVEAFRCLSKKEYCTSCLAVQSSLKIKIFFGPLVEKPKGINLH